MASSIYVIIPTYNERENIEFLLPIVLKKDADLNVLVVDDSSPDGTGEYVKQVSQENPRVHLLSRAQKGGLGAAYIAGFKHVLRHTQAEFVFEMDADFSHNPDRIPDFLKKIQEGNDLVVGSRYLNGVSVVNWPIRRLMLSYFASVYARMVTGLPLCDQTSGYKCFRRTVLENIDFHRVHSDGYAFQIEMNYLAYRQGFRLAEIPIIFEDRRAGYSKISRRIVFEALWMVWRLRLGLY